MYGIGPILTLLSVLENTLSSKWSLGVKLGLLSLLGRGHVGCAGRQLLPAPP